jgi:peptidoglycan/LPS O-acetylase OafA/YrhL
MLLPLPHIPHSVVHNPHLAYRPDIDGLRALAIVAVVIFHAFPHYLPGGFVGVDIFL